MAGQRGMIPELFLTIVFAAVLLLNLVRAQYPPAQFEQIGQSCGGSKLCPENGRCEGVCKCLDGYVASEDLRKCLQLTAQWEGNCIENAQCSDFSSAVCVGGICDCPQNHHFLDRSCWTTRYLKDECNNDNECYLDINADRIECRDRICECKEDYIISDDGKKCNGGSKLWNLGLVSLLLAVSIKQILI